MRILIILYKEKYDDRMTDIGSFFSLGNCIKIEVRYLNDIDSWNSKVPTIRNTEYHGVVNLHAWSTYKPLPYVYKILSL